MYKACLCEHRETDQIRVVFLRRISASCDVYPHRSSTSYTIVVPDGNRKKVYTED